MRAVLAQRGAAGVRRLPGDAEEQQRSRPLHPQKLHPELRPRQEGVASAGSEPTRTPCVGLLITTSCLLRLQGSQRGRSPERMLTQYQYTQWPEVGVPDLALPLLSFIRRCWRARTHAAGPVLVDCR